MLDIFATVILAGPESRRVGRELNCFFFSDQYFTYWECCDRDELGIVPVLLNTFSVITMWLLNLV